MTAPIGSEERSSVVPVDWPRHSRGRVRGSSSAGLTRREELTGGGQAHHKQRLVSVQSGSSGVDLHLSLSLLFKPASPLLPPLQQGTDGSDFRIILIRKSDII